MRVGTAAGDSDAGPLESVRGLRCSAGGGAGGGAPRLLGSGAR
ncbi:hypothetical protein Ae406Ps2_1616 [Pseudonocardia sp. Ae406_Ps2]|nr:hypothetical protein Ae406Ps2_1616 [Pseudonocardia sp. Ae406_Ps2]OLM13339.1 hypothetical protein Ae505Ps2_3467c [Pseudonocardia sp. Ae505_Ps2]OLM23187.1 hypothetical protein Ae706Ps2_1620 [Pseudonocardia sp. Ae706_Ps2]